MAKRERSTDPSAPPLRKRLRALLPADCPPALAASLDVLPDELLAALVETALDERRVADAARLGHTSRRFYAVWTATLRVYWHVRLRTLVTALGAWSALRPLPGDALAAAQALAELCHAAPHALLPWLRRNGALVPSAAIPRAVRARLRDAPAELLGDIPDAEVRQFYPLLPEERQRLERLGETAWSPPAWLAPLCDLDTLTWLDVWYGTAPGQALVPRPRQLAPAVPLAHWAWVRAFVAAWAVAEPSVCLAHVLVAALARQGHSDQATLMPLAALAGLPQCVVAGDPLIHLAVLVVLGTHTATPLLPNPNLEHLLDGTEPLFSLLYYVDPDEDAKRVTLTARAATTWNQDGSLQRSCLQPLWRFWFPGTGPRVPLPDKLARLLAAWPPGDTPTVRTVARAVATQTLPGPERAPLLHWPVVDATAELIWAMLARDPGQ